MKKLILIFLISSLYINSFGQKSASSAYALAREKIKSMEVKPSEKTALICVLDSNNYQNWDPGSNQWSNNYKEYFRYDSHLNNNQIQYFNGYNNSWTLSSKRLFTFNSGDKVLSEINQSLTGPNTWQDGFRTFNTYDIYNNLLSGTTDMWSVSGNTFTPMVKNTYTYNGQNKVTTNIVQHCGPIGNWTNTNRITYTYTGNNTTAYAYENWDLNTSAWLKMNKTTYTYNGSNQLLTMTDQSWNNTAWINSQKITFSYSAGNLNSVTVANWNSTSSTWKDYNRSLLAFDVNNNIASQTDQNWEPAISNWKNTYKYSYTYNSSHELLIQLEQTWLPNSTWEDAFKYTSTFDNNHHLIKQLQEYWETNSGGWIKNSLTSSFYNCTTVGINEVAENEELFKVYPNPAHSELHVKTGSEFETCVIMDLSGKEISRTGKNEGSISISEFSKGIYFIQLLNKDGKIVKAQKFVKD